MTTTGSLSYVTVRAGTQSTDGRVVPVASYWLAALTPHVLADGRVVVLWTLVDAAGHPWTATDADIVVPVLTPFPAVAPPTPSTNPVSP